MKPDVLIVGQGLAGTCLAIELLRRGVEVMVTDCFDAHAASRVAAGMFNPVTSRLRTNTWNAPEIFPALHDFYTHAEQLLSESFYHPLPMYRPFGSVVDQNGWSMEENRYIRRLHFEPAFPESVNDPFGGIELNDAGYVNVPRLLSAFRRHLENSGRYLAVDRPLLEGDERIAKFNRVVWCEGVAIASNPLFKWLPVSGLKGEILDINASIRRDILFNGPVWLVPMGDSNGFRVGSTYDRSLDPGNSKEGVAYLESRLASMLVPGFSLGGTDWGFRPVVRDRRPVMGPHPEHGSHMVFNGLGTKGVSLGPWCAARFSDWFTGKGSLPEALNISRFSTFYFKYLQD